MSLGNLQDLVWRSGFPSNTTLSVLFTTPRSTIFMVKICVYNHPFKNFRNKEHEGVEDLMWVMLERLSELGDFSYEQGTDGVLMKSLPSSLKSPSFSTCKSDSTCMSKNSLGSSLELILSNALSIHSMAIPYRFLMLSSHGSCAPQSSVWP